MLAILVYWFFIFSLWFLSCVDEHGIDMWSVGTVIYELFTGHVLFPGRMNNDMLRLMMLCKGRFSNKMLKAHFKSYEAMKMEPHFDTSNLSMIDVKFRQYEKDRVTGKVVMKLVDINPNPAVKLSASLLSSKAGSDDRAIVSNLSDLLEKMFNLDPAKRLTIDEAIKHPIFSISK